MKRESERQKLASLIGVLSTVMVAAIGSPAHAFEFDTGNPDVAMRWDNTVRYNLGWRAQNRDDRIVNGALAANSDLQFSRGDVITNRVDVLSEFDYVFQKKTGFRVSGQLWYDEAYDGNEKLNPAFPFPAYPGGRFNNYTKRWNVGPSAEFLDAFVFTGFNLGDVETNVKLGSHNVYWGESLFSFIHGVSYSQGPVDVRKAVATPGIEAKELFKPLNQFSFTSQFTKEFSIAGQYYFDWKPTVFPDGGTYWGIYDAVNGAGGTTLPNGYPWVGANNLPKDKRGDWGLMARWSPEWLGGSLGFYYRDYTDKLPLFANGANGVGGFTGLGQDYANHRSTITGISLSKSVAGVAVGAEITHRHKTNLLMGDFLTVGSEPVGDTWHALVNVLGYTGKTPLFDSMVWLGELTYSKLDKVTANPTQFRSVENCRASIVQTGTGTLSCATKDNWGIALKIEPKWMQVFDGVDLSMPIFYTTGLKGTSPVLFGGYEGNGSYSIGVTADYLNKYNFALAYNGVFAKKTQGPGNTIADTGGIGYWWDRGNVTFTFKTTF